MKTLFKSIDYEIIALDGHIEAVGSTKFIEDNDSNLKKIARTIDYIRFKDKDGVQMIEETTVYYGCDFAIKADTSCQIVYVKSDTGSTILAVHANHEFSDDCIIFNNSLLTIRAQIEEKINSSRKMGYFFLAVAVPAMIVVLPSLIMIGSSLYMFKQAKNDKKILTQFLAQTPNLNQMQSAIKQWRKSIISPTTAATA